MALHRAKWLAEHYAAEGEKILFTTFTVNLAADIQENLKKICNAQKIQFNKLNKVINYSK